MKDIVYCEGLSVLLVVQLGVHLVVSETSKVSF